MKNLSIKKVTQIVKKYDLTPTSERKASMLLLSSVGLAYTKLIKKTFGMDYKALVALGDRDSWNIALNEARLAKESESFLKKHQGRVDEKLFDIADTIFEKIKQRFEDSKKFVKDDPKRFLKIVTDIYPVYLTSLGAYNGIYRYVGNEKEVPLLSKEQIKHTERRDIIGKLYDEIESLVKECLKSIKEDFDTDVLRSLTIDELKMYLAGRLPKEILEDAEKRRKRFFYLCVDGKEYIFTDKKILDYVENAFYRVETKGITEVKGFGAYPGIVKGIVVNLKDHGNKETPKDMILVTNMTRPYDLPLVMKSLAIVTNEGSMLCHAAITARELKKPCVIGTKIATKIFRTGDVVEVNADTGVVRKL